MWCELQWVIWPTIVRDVNDTEPSLNIWQLWHVLCVEGRTKKCTIMPVHADSDN